MNILKMVRKCIVKNCDLAKGRERKMFSFPNAEKSAERFQSWLQFVGLGQDTKISQSWRVCEVSALYFYHLSWRDLDLLFSKLSSIQQMLNRVQCLQFHFSPNQWEGGIVDGVQRKLKSSAIPDVDFREKDRPKRAALSDISNTQKVS